MKKHAGVVAVSLIASALAYVLYAGAAVLLGVIFGWHTFYMLMRVAGLLVVFLFVILIFELS